jgi:hypothetical protein
MAALIRACLVAGYGNIAVDGITVAGGIATATITNNTLEVGTVIEITGATPAELNAEWKITAADSGSITFSTPGIADVTATGTIGASIPAAGWEEPYPESGNYACFRALSGVRQFYQIDDNQADADVTYMTMFDSMSDAQSGIGSRGGSFFGKQNGSGSTWFVIADEKTCYVCLSSTYGLVPHGFGEYSSLIDADPNKAFLAGHATDGYMVQDARFAMGHTYKSSTSWENIYCMTDLKGNSGAMASLNIGVNGESQYCPSGLYSDDLVLAAAPGEKYRVDRAFFATNAPENTKNSRGHLRGVYYPMAYKPKNSGENFKIDDRDFLAVNIGGASNDTRYQGQIFFDISQSWEESL